MMILPGLSTSIPRSLAAQVLPSMWLSVPVTWMPAPSPPLPFSPHLLARTKQLEVIRMPLSLLACAVQLLIVQPKPVKMPLPVFWVTVQLLIVQPKPGEMPLEVF